MAVVPDRVLEIAVGVCSSVVADVEAEPALQVSAWAFLEALGRSPAPEPVEE